MRLVSVNVGLPREIGSYRGRPVSSGIFKDPVNGPVAVGRYNLVGDGQSDLSVHGGADKAAYVYPSEHYGYWREKLPGMNLNWGAFGENLTTEGVLEEEVRPGDVLVTGSAEFAVTKPRLPCYKLGIKFGTQRMLKWFLDSERSGFYLRVTREGVIRAGDSVTLVKNGEDRQTIASIVRDVKTGESNE